MSVQSLYLVASSLLHLVSVYAQASCYYPGGKLAAGDTPCNPKEPHSICCNPLDICLSNRLCYSVANNHIERGSCTDSSWSSGSCTDICTRDIDSTTGWADVMQCPGTNTYYCGFYNQGRCNSSNPDTFNLPPGYLADFRNASSIPNSSATPATSITTISSTSTVMAKALETLGPCPPTPTSQSCPSDSAARAGIGAGIGISLATGLAAAVLLYFRERRLRKKMTEEYSSASKHELPAVHDQPVLLKR